MSLSPITAPYEFTAGTSPLLISIPHAGTRLTPEVAEGLSEAAQPLGDTDWHIPACMILPARSGPVCWSAIIPVLLST
jgi:N-formylglutamate amidohydrolase